MSAAQASADVRPVSSPLDGRCLAALAAWTALVLFVALAALLAVRRLTGAMTQPLPGPLLVPLGAALASAMVLLRVWLLPADMRGLRASRRLTWRIISWWSIVALPSLALALLLVSVMTPGTSLPAALATLLFAGVIEGLFWRHIAVALRAFPTEPAADLPHRSAQSAETASEQNETEEESYPASLFQQIVRTRDEAGREAIHAVLRAEFQPGEQVQVLHIAFCPPLASPPRLEAMTAGRTVADVKVTAEYTFGARLEVHLSSPAVESIELIVELMGEARHPT